MSDRMATPRWHCSYTSEQLLKLLAAWGVACRLPTRKESVHIGFPGAVLNKGTVTVSPHKSTYGKRLYLVVLESVSAVEKDSCENLTGKKPEEEPHV